jgi:hypothetical protein
LDWGNEEVGLVSFLLEIPYKLRKRDRFLKWEAFAVHGDRVDVRRPTFVAWLGAAQINFKMIDCLGHAAEREGGRVVHRKKNPPGK